MTAGDPARPLEITFQIPTINATETRLQILGELRGEVMVLEPMVDPGDQPGRRPGRDRVSPPAGLAARPAADPRRPLVVVKGRVVHCSISDVDQELVIYRSGIEFIELSDRVYSVIAEFIDAIKDGRRAV